MSDNKSESPDGDGLGDYQDRLDEPGVLCLEVYGTEFVAIVWKDPEHGIITNLRFGSGRHHTVVEPEFDRLVGRESVKGVNVVSMDKAREVSQ